MNKEVNAVDLGADPTGMKDSTAAIQLAMDHHVGAYLPRGNYSISKPLGIYTGKLHGDGMATILVATEPMPAMIRSVYAGTSYGNVLTEVFVDGLRLDGAGKATMGLDLTQIAYSRFDNIQVYSCLDAGILLSDVSNGNILLQNIIVKHCRDGVRLEGNANACTLSHVIAMSNSRNGVRVTNAMSTRIFGGDIEGNEESGIYCGKTWGVCIRGVHLEGNKGWQIETAGTDNPMSSVDGCVIVPTQSFYGPHIKGCDMTKIPLRVEQLGHKNQTATYAR